MNRIVKILLTALVVLCCSSCGKSLKDIQVTSCKLTSISPRGLSSFDASLDLVVDNPSVQVSLTKMSATLKMNGEPCLYLTADDVTLNPKSQEVYTLTVHGLMDSKFNPFSLLSLLQDMDLEPMSVDVFCHGALKSGIGKDFVYKDLPLKDLLDKI